MTSSPLMIRPFEAADLPRVLEFLQATFPEAAAKGDPRHFQWQFADHPLGSSLDGYYLAWRGETLVGQLASMRDRLWIDGEWREARWLVDLMIAPEHRGGLAALRLFQAIMERPELLLTVGAGPAMEPLYRGLAWRRMLIAKTYYLPIRPRALLRMARATGRETSSGLDAMHPKELLTALAGGVIHRVLPGVVRKLQHATPDFRCEPIQQFDEAIDHFLAQTLPQLGITTWRSASSLKWKFHDRPASHPLAWIVRESNSNSVRGMLCARLAQRKDLASWLEIVDLVTLPSDRAAFIALLATAMETALSERLDFIRLRLSRPEQQAWLPNPWWREHTLPVTDEVFAYSKDSNLLESLEREPWHLTSVVSDRAEDGRTAEDADA